MHDEVRVNGLRGHVEQVSSVRGLLWEGHNLVVDLAPEVMMASLLGSTHIDQAAFGYGAGRQVTPSTRSIPGVITIVTASSKTVGRDKMNRRTLGTWRFTWTPTAAQTYDMLGLLATSQQLFAATAFPAVTLQANESVSVAWTIYLRD